MQLCQVKSPSTHRPVNQLFALKMHHPKMARVFWVESAPEVGPAYCHPIFSQFIKPIISPSITRMIFTWQLTQRLRWYGYVQWATPVIKFVTDFSIRAPAIENDEGLERHGPNVGRLMSEKWENVACLALTRKRRKTETNRGPVFDIAWCCQPHQMGHWQHPKLERIWN